MTIDEIKRQMFIDSEEVCGNTMIDTYQAQEYVEQAYNKAVDDFAENISLEISESLIWGMIADCFKYKNMNDTSDKIVDYVINTANEIAEQLKAGKENERM